MTLTVQEDATTSRAPRVRHLRERYVRNIRKWRALKSSIEMVDNGRAMLVFMEYLAATIQLGIEQGRQLQDVALEAFNAADYVAGGLGPDLQQLSVELLCLHWNHGTLLRRWYQSVS